MEILKETAIVKFSLTMMETKKLVRIVCCGIEGTKTEVYTSIVLMNSNMQEILALLSTIYPVIVA